MFDGNERLVVCNRRYLELYHLPEDVVKPGITLNGLLEYRIANGSFSQDALKYRQTLLSEMKEGKIRQAEVKSADGRTILVINRPMADGGWVATLSANATRCSNSSSGGRSSSKQSPLSGSASRNTCAPPLPPA